MVLVDWHPDIRNAGGTLVMLMYFGQPEPLIASLWLMISSLLVKYGEIWDQATMSIMIGAIVTWGSTVLQNQLLGRAGLELFFNTLPSEAHLVPMSPPDSMCQWAQYYYASFHHVSPRSRVAR